MEKSTKNPQKKQRKFNFKNIKHLKSMKFVNKNAQKNDKKVPKTGVYRKAKYYKSA